METSANAVRFFGALGFTTPAETRRGLRYLLCWSALRFCRPPGTGRAYNQIMLKNGEDLNTRNDALPLVTAAEFRAEVLESRQPVLVEFWTPWSRPCQVLDSVLQELAGAAGGAVKVVKVDADDCLDLSLWYDIQSVPTLLYFVE